MTTQRTKSIGFTTTSLHSRGFTLIELLIVMGILALLFSFTIINLTSVVGKASLEGATSVFVSDLKQQQLKAMIGESEGGLVSQSYGVYFETNRYTLFRGTIFNVSDSNNFIVNLEQGLELSNTFPTSTVVFAKGSGEISASNNVTVRNLSSGQTKVVTVSRYGVITIQ